jgi:hypothetical protein
MYVQTFPYGGVMVVSFPTNNYTVTVPSTSNKPAAVGPNTDTRQTQDYFAPIGLRTSELPEIKNITPLPEQRTLQDILLSQGSEKIISKGITDISFKENGKQMQCVYYTGDGTAGRSLTIKLPDDAGQDNIQECFLSALQGENPEVVIGGLRFEISYNQETEQFLLINDDTKYNVPLSTNELVRATQNTDKTQYINASFKGTIKFGVDWLKLLAKAVRNLSTGDTDKALTELLSDLKTLGKDRALDLLNDLYQKIRDTQFDTIFMCAPSLLLYDAMYALETIDYESKLNDVREEFQTATQNVGFVDKLQKLIEIYNQWQKDIDALSGITRNEPQLKLLHTKLLKEFVIKTFVEDMFLLDLFEQHAELKDSMFMFGFGRLLSEHNKLGASVGSDMDSNVLFDNSTGQISNNLILCNDEEKDFIGRALQDARTILKTNFKVDMEIDDRFTIQSYQEFNRALTDRRTSDQAIRFYTAIQTDYYVFWPRPQEQDGELVSSDIQDLRIKNFQDRISNARDASGLSPAQLIFDEMLNISSKYSIGIIHNKVDGLLEEDRKLTIGKDARGNKIKVSEVIGSGNEEPDNWYFSMKYTVNRFYDFLYKIDSLKDVSMFDIGLMPADKLFIENMNNLMLVLQNYAFTLHPEHGDYLSAEDFQTLYALPEFKKDFQLIAEKAGIQIDFLSSTGALFTKDYKRIGYKFFQEVDRQMFNLYNRIINSKTIKTARN